MGVRVWIQKAGDLFSHESWTLLAVARGHHGPVAKVRLSDDGRRMVTVGREEGRAMLWDTTPNREAATVGPRFRPVQQVVADPHGTRLALLAYGAPCILGHGREAVADRFARNVGIAFYKGIALSPDGKSVVIAGGKDQSAICDVATGKELAPLHGHAGKVVSADTIGRGTES